MDRNFTDKELTMLIDNSMDTQTNLLPYCCRDNIDCWTIIRWFVKTVKKYDITPERYWHGSSSEFTWLLVLLSGNYPSPKELLRMARDITTGEIKNIADHFYQHINVMFNFVKQHHGYVVLSPTSYMQSLYPNSKDMLYVYTSDKWSHNESSHIDGAVLIFRADDMESFLVLLKKKLGIIV